MVVSSIAYLRSTSTLQMSEALMLPYQISLSQKLTLKPNPLFVPYTHTLASHAWLRSCIEIELVLQALTNTHAHTHTHTARTDGRKERKLSLKFLYLKLYLVNVLSSVEDCVLWEMTIVSHFSADNTIK